MKRCIMGYKKFPPLYGLNELPEVHCEFAVNLIGMSTMAILTAQSWGVLSNPDSSQPVPGSEIVGSAELRKHEHENNFHLCVIPTVLEPGTG